MTPIPLPCINGSSCRFYLTGNPQKTCLILTDLVNILAAGNTGTWLNRLQPAGLAWRDEEIAHNVVPIAGAVEMLNMMAGDRQRKHLVAAMRTWLAEQFPGPETQLPEQDPDAGSQQRGPASIYLTAEERSFVLRAGDGNLSAGIRRGLHALRASLSGVPLPPPPPPAPPRRPLVVGLTDEERELAASLGDGSMAEGLRRALLHATRES